jgi:hypothetical protein
MSSKAYIVENGLVVRNGNITFSNTSGEAGTFILPAYTTTERNSLAGVQSQSLIYNTDDKEIQMYDGSGWLTNIETDIVFPQVTTGDMSTMSPVSGQSVYNTTSSVLQMYNGTSWVNAGSDGLVVFPQATTGDMSTMSPVSGQSVYNTTSSVLQMYNGTSWIDAGDTGYVVFPELTTDEMAMLTPVSGESVYNVSDKKLEIYNGSAWVNSADSLPDYNHYFTIDVNGEGDFSTIRSGVAAINTAGDNTAVNSYALILKPGTHVVDSLTLGPLSLPDWTYIIGDSPATTTIDNIASTFNLFTITGSNGFYNLEIKTNCDPFSGFASIIYNNGDCLILDNCTFRPDYNDLCYILDSNGSKSIKINNCNFDKNTTSTSVNGMLLFISGCNDVYIKNSQFNLSSGTIASFQNSTGVIEDCRFYNSSTSGSNATGITMGIANDFLIKDSSFDKFKMCVVDQSSGTKYINNCLYTTTATSSRFFLVSNGAGSDVKINNCIYPVSSISQGGGELYNNNLSYGYTTLITATGDITLTNDYSKILVIDPNGSNRDVDLPWSGISFNGETFVIINNDSVTGNLLSIKNVEGYHTTSDEILGGQQGVEVIFYNGKWYTKQYINSSNADSIHIGNNSYAYAESLALGINATATSISISIGNESYASVSSVAIGYSATASGASATLGANSRSYDYSVSIGERSSSFNKGVALGYQTTASHSNSVSLGIYSLTRTPNEINHRIGDYSYNVCYNLECTNKGTTYYSFYVDKANSLYTIYPNGQAVTYKGPWELYAKITINSNNINESTPTIHTATDGYILAYGDSGGTTTIVDFSTTDVTSAGITSNFDVSAVVEGFQLTVKPNTSDSTTINFIARLDGVLRRES